MEKSGAGKRTMVLSKKEDGSIKQAGVYSGNAPLDTVFVPPGFERTIFDGEIALDLEEDVVRGGKVVSRFDNNTEVFKRTDPFSVLFVRHVGLGDALVCASLAKHVKEEWPNSWVAIGILPHWRELFEGVVGVDELLDQPIRHLPVNRYDASFKLDGTFDGARDSAVNSRPAILYRYLGLKSPKETMKTPWIDISTRGTNLAAAWLRERGVNRTHRIVGIQIDSVSPMRAIPEDIRNAIIVALSEMPGVKVIQFGMTTTEPCMRPLEYAGSVNAVDMSLAKTAALMRKCDVMIAPDSGLMHLAAALGVDTVALFGTMPAYLRTEFYPHVHAVEAEDPGCGRFTCNDLANNEGWGRSYCFNATGSGSMCMRTIRPTRVVEAVCNLLKLDASLDTVEDDVFVTEVL